MLAMKSLFETLVSPDHISCREQHAPFPKPEGDLRFPALILMLRSKRLFKKCPPMASDGVHAIPRRKDPRTRLLVAKLQVDLCTDRAI